MIKLRNILTFAFICLVPFQDTFLQGTPLLGLGISFAILPLLTLIGIDTLVLPLRGNVHVPRIAIYFFLYALIINIMGLEYFGLQAGSANTLVEGIKLAIDTILALYVVFGIDYSEASIIAPAVKIAFAITLIGISFNDLNLFGMSRIFDNPIFHFTVNQDLRLRGLTRESFWLGMVVMSFGLLSAHYSVRTSTKILYWGITILITVMGGSKGGFLSLLGVLTIILIVRRGGVKQLVLVGLALGPIVYMGLKIFFSQISPELLLVTESIPTRVTMLFWSATVLLHFPLGVGFTGFLPAMQHYLPIAKDMSIRLFGTPNANFNEINDTLSDVNGASTKSMIATFTAFYGFPFLVLIFIGISRILRALFVRRHITLLAVVLFVLFGITTYDDVIFGYQVFIVLGIAVNEYRLYQGRCKLLPKRMKPWYESQTCKLCTLSLVQISQIHSGEADVP